MVPLPGPNNGPPSKKGANHKNIQYLSHCNPLFFFETALDYKPQILDPKIEEFPCLLKNGL